MSQMISIQLTSSCHPDGAPGACAVPLIFQSHFNLEQFFLSGEDTWLSVVLHKCCSSLVCLGLSVRGQPRAHGGC